MLIKCPECNKEISDKATICIHCGCPIQQIYTKNICIINEKEYDFNDIMQILPKVGNKDTDVHPLYIAGRIMDKTSLNWKCSNELAQIIIANKSIPKSYEGSIEIKNISNKPKCPTCGSTNVKPISTTERAASVVGLGLLSKKINKTYKCLNCKSTW